MNVGEPWPLGNELIPLTESWNCCVSLASFRFDQQLFQRFGLVFLATQTVLFFAPIAQPRKLEPRCDCSG